MPNPNAPSRSIRLLVTLRHIEPQIWRRLLVPAEITLAQLHYVLQAAMGWTDSHLHDFQIGGVRYGDPSEDEWEEEPRLQPEEDTRLDQVIHRAGQRFTYVYDYGDNWEHEVVVEEITTRGAEAMRAFCLGGARACPPEDVGGAYSYAEFLEALSDPSHEDHEDYMAWGGGEFDSEYFDPVDVNQQLEFMAGYWRSGGGPSSLRH